MAAVELQLVMHFCDQRTLIALARCSRATLAAASQPFAWRSLSLLSLSCSSPLELSARMADSLLRSSPSNGRSLRQRVRRTRMTR
jgi:hypothetical protein